MRLYNSIGPNPKVVRMFMAEKGIQMPMVEVDLMGGENRRDEHLKRNPSGQTPTLELDDGRHIAEITVICEYLDEVTPGKSLLGDTPEQKAETRMWVRRIDLNILEPMANGFRYAEGIKIFQNRMRCLPEAAPGLKAIAQDKLGWLNEQMNGNQYVCGDRFTLADIPLFCFLDFFSGAGQPMNPDHKNIAAWYERVKQRPSASA